MRPPWKGLGGKRDHLPVVLPQLASSYVPEHDRRIVEPFAGTAVVAANHPYRRVWVNDTNAAFTNLLNWIVREPDALLEICRDVWRLYGDGSQGKYLRAREVYNDNFGAGASQSVEAAAMTLFLNKHGFNGLYRLNRKGEFNTPWGKRTAKVPEAEIAVYHWAFARRETEITSLDFREVMARCGDGDAVFCDPPYVPLSETSSFTAYGNRWNEGRHIVLDKLAAEAADRGAAVVVCASDTPKSREYYASARTVMDIRVQRRVGASAASRKAVGELLFIY